MPEKKIEMKLFKTFKNDRSAGDKARRKRSGFLINETNEVSSSVTPCLFIEYSFIYWTFHFLSYPIEIKDVKAKDVNC